MEAKSLPMCYFHMNVGHTGGVTDVNMHIEGKNRDIKVVSSQAWLNASRRANPPNDSHCPPLLRCVLRLPCAGHGVEQERSRRLHEGLLSIRQPGVTQRLAPCA
jgi:hypothetical protein